MINNFLNTSAEVVGFIASALPGVNFVVGGIKIHNNTEKLERIDQQVTDFAKNVLSSSPQNKSLAELSAQAEDAEHEVFKGQCEACWIPGMLGYVIYSVYTAIFSKPKEPIDLMSDVIRHTDAIIKEKTNEIISSASQEMRLFHYNNGTPWQLMSGLETSLIGVGNEVIENSLSEGNANDIFQTFLNLEQMKRCLKAGKYDEAKKCLESMAKIGGNVSFSDNSGVSFRPHKTVSSLKAQINDVILLAQKKESLEKAKAKVIESQRESEHKIQYEQMLVEEQGLTDDIERLKALNEKIKKDTLG